MVSPDLYDTPSSSVSRQLLNQHHLTGIDTVALSAPEPRTPEAWETIAVRFTHSVCDVKRLIYLSLKSKGSVNKSLLTQDNHVCAV